MMAWGAVSGHLGSMGVVAVPQSASKVVDDLIYRRLNPGDRERVDHLLAQQKCGPLPLLPRPVLRCPRQLP